MVRYPFLQPEKQKNYSQESVVVQIVEEEEEEEEAMRVRLNWKIFFCYYFACCLNGGVYGDRFNFDEIMPFQKVIMDLVVALLYGAIVFLWLYVAYTLYVVWLIANINLHI